MIEHHDREEATDDQQQDRDEPQPDSPTREAEPGIPDVPEESEVAEEA